MRTAAYFIIGVIAFFGALNLVHDPEPPKIIFLADMPTMQCPIEGGCVFKKE